MKKNSFKHKAPKILFIGALLLFIFTGSLYAQNKNIDSLLTLIKTDKPDTNKVNHSYNLCREYINIGLYDTAIYYGNSALQLAQQLNFKKGIANSYGNIGTAYKEQGDYPRALDYDFRALKIDEELNNKKGIAIRLGNIGIIYIEQGDDPKALDYYSKALKIDEELNNKKGIARHLGNIGNVYKEQGDYLKALDCYFKALKIDEELGDKKGIAIILGSIGNVYDDQADYPKALDYDFRALKTMEKLGSKNYIAAIFNNIGGVYANQKDYLKALDCHFKALKIHEELGDKNGIAINLTNVGAMYVKQEDYPKALDYEFKALKMAKELGDKTAITANLGNIGSTYIDMAQKSPLPQLRKEDLYNSERINILGSIPLPPFKKEDLYKEAYNYIYRALTLSDSIGAKNDVKTWYEQLSNLYEKSNISLPDSIGGKLLTMEQMRLRSMYYYKRSIAIRDTLFSQENKKQLVRKEMNFEFDKKEAATKTENEKQQAIAEEKSHKQKVVLILVSFVLLLVFVFAGFIFRSLRITRKQKNIIELQKNEVSKQKEKITDSITYAQRIQQSILMEESEIQNYLPDSFIYYQPKDIVSGDFYWCNKIDDKIILAAVDCTGHGVPGAFMSMIGNTLLNQIVNEQHVTTPSEILRLLNLGVYEALHQVKDGTLSRDGMDIALCSIDYKNKLLQYAGAPNPLYIVSNNQIEVVKADIHGIGGGGMITKKFDPIKRQYTNHVIPIKEGMSIYLFSDGYMDQFGGSERKKFGIQKFKDLLLNNQHLSMQKQKIIIASAYAEWKGNEPQIDDVLVMGVKL